MIGATSTTGLAAIIGAIGAGIPALAAWWRSTRIARQRADDTTWTRVQAMIKQQADDLIAERGRCDLAERNLRRCSNQYDRLLSYSTRRGGELPPALEEKPWDDPVNGGLPPRQGE